MAGQDQAYKEKNSNPMAAFGYGGVGVVRAIEYLRGISPSNYRWCRCRVLCVFFKASPLGQNVGMDRVAVVLKPGLNAILGELACWAKTSKATRKT
ncbi:MAG: hypothetical protein Q4G22_02090 [Paracoccus sp. (in: a-proteobacteria)]|uniref:hypothetical protein n=1 Tax=Paracoccus sp. TaxID=267 RepID=UPI0026DF46B9|nr:hypothetical protein [Paracoccus sp. (in: a-proteobacteria)]MDO5630607.1 hypothetical protein [Paracoccus sp. (in: a-proteobacteria)]